MGYLLKEFVYLMPLYLMTTVGTGKGEEERETEREGGRGRERKGRERRGGGSEERERENIYAVIYNSIQFTSAYALILSHTHILSLTSTSIS